MPRVTVLMTVYNNARYLGAAVESILAQSWPDFEFLIVDDGSGDGSRDVLARYAAQDGRIRLHFNARNIGLARSLNVGLAMAQGEYVARMDDDDVSLPERLARQVAYLDAHPQVAALGTDWAQVGEDDQPLDGGRPVYGLGASPAYADWLLQWQNPLAHASVMLRRSVLEAHRLRYDPTFSVTEDYDLWTRLAQHGQIARLGDVLLHRRILASSVSVAQQARQIEQTGRIVARELARRYGDALPVLGREYLTAWRFPAEAQASPPPPHSLRPALEVLAQLYHRLPASVSPQERAHARQLVRACLLKATARAKRRDLRLWAAWRMGAGLLILDT
ncbi:MAG: glycosyltransferase family 2 protein [Anaerolineae bacterium]|nr:glycosyltransferase family 2 protein [Anaerolineae bacterium]MDW8171600.1 glycosyltransferase family A protein [Anaerolineae bacterium]